MRQQTGATVETIRNAIEWRLRDEMAALRAKHGDQAVDEALDAAGEMHAGCEEIGSSDVYYMAQSFRNFLPTEN